MTRQDTPNRSAQHRRPGDVPEQDYGVRQEDIRKDVAKRLRKACRHLSDEDFAALVEKIVKVQLKSEGRSR